jgi:hypothetical protein
LERYSEAREAILGGEPDMVEPTYQSSNENVGTGVASAFLGAALSFVGSNKRLIAWAISENIFRSPSGLDAWEVFWWPLLGNVSLRFILGGALGGVAALWKGRTFRRAFWWGLVSGFIGATVLVPPLTMAVE